ncbi:alpha/beta hydrolase [Dactylosporangium sp. AC04546]|uniref:serine aminopeptidase domain-containing protein n=1 Tax=Dactylosporangium sp. AC04546 TaxID=2862460 RepID=UPI001EDD02AF|nr:alpha/beta hydrolase [Dactylosporangium sp. AC04546]WVK85993.1 alpha/beta hydrolase [Dactylosporangium sp. AC04546]
MDGTIVAGTPWSLPADLRSVDRPKVPAVGAGVQSVDRPNVPAVAVDVESVDRPSVPAVAADIESVDRPSLAAVTPGIESVDRPNVPAVAVDVGSVDRPSVPAVAADIESVDRPNVAAVVAGIRSVDRPNLAAVAAGVQSVDRPNVPTAAADLRSVDRPTTVGSVGRPTETRGVSGLLTADWDAELEARSACPTHQARLSGDTGFRRGALAEALPAGLRESVDPTAVNLPVLVVHGEADQVAPADGARELAGALARVELATVRGGRHDALNDITHRTVAAHVVQWLERLRAGKDVTPILTVTRAHR